MRRMTRRIPLANVCFAFDDEAAQPLASIEPHEPLSQQIARDL
jgi:hypothetical protein